MPARPAAVVCCALALTLPIAAQDAAALKGMVRTLEQQQKKFGEDKAAARKKVLTRFDEEINKIKARTKGETKANLLSQFEAAKEAFQSSEQWPDGLMLPAQFEYAKAIAAAYRPVSRTLNDLIEGYLRAGDKKEAEDWRQAKEKADAQLAGRADLTGGSRWHGTLTVGKHTSILHLNVHKVTGNLIAGEVHQDVGTSGNPIFEVHGTADGNHLSLKVTKVIRGTARLQTFDGYVLGQGRMIINYHSVNGKKPPLVGLIQLNKQPQK